MLLYLFTGRRRRGAAGHFSLGKYEIPVIAGALIWLTYELIVLIGPNEFRDAQYYVLGALGVGLVFYAVQWLLEPAAMRTEQGAHGHDALDAYTSSSGGSACVNILAIDQGTSATKALLVGPGQHVLGTGEAPVRNQAAGDAVEVDPEELYSSVLAAGQAALAAARAPADALALANQGETVLAWDTQTRSAAYPRDQLAGPSVRGGLRATRCARGAACRHYRPAA